MVESEARTTVQVKESGFEGSKGEIAILVDELGGSATEYAEAKKIIKKFEDKRKILIAKSTEGYEATDEVTVHGDTHTVVIGGSSEKRMVTDKKVIYDALGNDVFLELSRFALGDLDKYLNPAQLEKAITKENSGPRKVTIGLKTGEVV